MNECHEIILFLDGEQSPEPSIRMADIRDVTYGIDKLPKPYKRNSAFIEIITVVPEADCTYTFFIVPLLGHAEHKPVLASQSDLAPISHKTFILCNCCVCERQDTCNLFI